MRGRGFDLVPLLESEYDPICYLCGSSKHVSRQKLDLDNSEKDILEGFINICEDCLEDTK